MPRVVSPGGGDGRAAAASDVDDNVYIGAEEGRVREEIEVADMSKQEEGEKEQKTDFFQIFCIIDYRFNMTRTVRRHLIRLNRETKIIGEKKSVVLVGDGFHGVSDGFVHFWVKDLR